MLSTLELSPQTLDADAPVRIAVKNLDFYYGEHKALKNINLDFRDRHVTALIGPSGCGKSTLLRIFNRIYSLYPEQRATGEILLDGRNVISQRYRCERAALAHRHGVPEADALPDVDLRQCRLRHPPLREAAEVRARRPRRGRAAPLRALGRGQGQAQDLRHGPVRRPAAAPLHRAHHRAEAGSDPVRRADLGARPDLDRQDRGPARAAQDRLHHRHRHPQHAAGGAHLAVHRLHVSR